MIKIRPLRKDKLMSLSVLFSHRIILSDPKKCILSVYENIQTSTQALGFCSYMYPFVDKQCYYYAHKLKWRLIKMDYYACVDELEEGDEFLEDYFSGVILAEQIVGIMNREMHILTASMVSVSLELYNSQVERNLHLLYILLGEVASIFVKKQSLVVEQDKTE